MAFKQNQIPGHSSSWISSLAIPRRLTLPVLMLLGLATAQAVWLAFDSVKILAWLSGLASPFCMLCATAVWAMRDKAELAFTSDSLNSAEYLRAQNIENNLRHRSTLLAAQTAFSALIAATPAMSNQLIGPVWQIMVLGCGCAVAFAIYAYLISSFWEYQIRAQRSKEVFGRKQVSEQKELTEYVEKSAKNSSTLFPGWTEGPQLQSKKIDH
jgi:hypothetical protein